MSKRKGEVSKEKILTAAENLFASHGYHGTTVSQIVSEAGLTQAAFYLYFKSKEKILEEIFFNFEQELIRYVESGKQLNQKSQSGLENHLLQAYMGLFELFSSNQNVTKIVFSEGEKSDVLRAKIVTVVSRNVRNNQLNGLVKPEVDPEFFAELLVASIERIVARWMGGEERYTSEELGRSMGNIFFHGVLIKS